jgi:hypothetical protein
MHRRENARVYKWKEMLDKYPFKIHSKLRSRGRKGIPDSFRGYAWCLLTEQNSNNEQSQKVTQQKQDIEKLMVNLMNQEGDKKILHDIHKDVSRTLPNHVYFQEKFVYGQKDLFSVLKCLSIVEPEIGYVQGMGYMVAILLMYVDKTDAFSIMLKVINNKPYSMKEFYS